MAMTEKTAVLKNEILKQYKSVRRFALEMEIPYSTLVTALDRGIDGMAYGTVVRICERLNINPVTFTPLSDTTVSAELMENKVMANYVRLNQEGKDKILELMEDFCNLKKYQM